MFFVIAAVSGLEIALFTIEVERHGSKMRTKVRLLFAFKKRIPR